MSEATRNKDEIAEKLDCASMSKEEIQHKMNDLLGKRIYFSDLLRQITISLIDVMLDFELDWDEEKIDDKEHQLFNEAAIRTVHHLIKGLMLNRFRIGSYFKSEIMGTYFTNLLLKTIDEWREEHPLDYESPIQYLLYDDKAELAWIERLKRRLPPGLRYLSLIG